ncbi:MAG: copper chaperone PCu(A)C, partial [Burkholderiaceae bacterium]|nr:copper chaperone PCu(A)C [Burkholderiaceae bacterium]
MKKTPSTLAAIALALFAASAAPALAQVTVKDAWVRGTAPQQRATGAFMQLTSASDAKVVAAESAAAAIVEIHEMRMDGGVMRMRALSALELPANRTVELKPGGYHVMLIDLKQPLKEGDTVALRLTVESSDGKRSTVDVSAPVRA